jgi:hypothetical protein
MGNTHARRTPVPSVEELKTGKLVSDIDGKEYEVGTTVVGEDGVEKVLVSKEWLEEITTRLERAERPVLVKAKEAVVSHKRKLIIAGATVASLGVAAFAATHRDLLAEKLEETAEVVAEKTEDTADKARHEARDVKNTAKRAQTRRA